MGVFVFSRSTERECLLFRGLILFEIVTLLLSDLNNVHIKYPLTWNQLMAFSSLGYFGLFFTSVSDIALGSDRHLHIRHFFELFY